MNTLSLTKKQWFVLAGDIVTLALVTLSGFATHGTLGSAGGRMLATFIPLVLSWLLTAPLMGVYDVARLGDGRQVWRPFWAMVIAGPLAAWMRAILLKSNISPIFVVILGGISALAILAWRIVYALAAAYLIRRSSGRKQSSEGKRSSYG